MKNKVNKIALINCNETKAPFRVAPLGIAFIASFFKDLSFEVLVIDTPFRQKDYQNMIRQIIQFEPDVIGLGIRNLDNSDFQNFKTFLETPKKIADLLKPIAKNAPIVIGGSAPTVDPEIILEKVGGDYIILGEGEAGLLEFIRKYEQQEEIPKIFKDGDSPFRVKDVSLLPKPALFEWVDIKKFLKSDAGYPIQTKRGCPLRCSYCTYSIIEGRQYRFLPVKMIVDEIEDAVKAGVKDFEFVDSTFNLPLKHSKAILDEIIARKLKANFVGAGINPCHVDQEFFDKMKLAGFKSICITAESASEVMLSSYAKGFDIKKLINTAQLVKNCGIKTLWVFLIGGPKENKETVEETLTFIDAYILKSDVVYITSGIRIYPGSPIDIQKQKGMYDQESLAKETSINASFYQSSSISKNNLREMLINFRDTHPNIIFSDEGHDSLTSYALRIMMFLNIPKPYWQYTKIFNRLKNLFLFKPNKRRLT